jgi:drug/metabolite transporter (DMT)-like permease
VTTGSDHLGAGGNLRGTLAMIAGMAGFVTNDMFIKLASETLPTGQIIFLRGLLTTTIIIAIAHASGALARWTEALRPAVGWRTVGEVCATVLYLTALFHIPIANATAILQAMPIIITLAAALFLDETVGWRRWLAVGTGFVGMLMIVQPGGAGFNAYALFAVAALAFLALRDISTRAIPLVVPAILVTLAASLAVTVAGAVLGLTEDWVMPQRAEFGLLLGAAATLTAGYFFVVEAMRYGEMSAVAPFRYTILVWAIVYGILIWGEVPDLLAIGGIVLIAGSGLFVFYRENRRRREIAAGGSAAS